MRFVVPRADVNLHMIVPDAADNVAAEFVTTEFSGTVAVQEPNLTSGPIQ